MKDEESYDSISKPLQLLFDFLPSLTITALNAGIPIIFKIIVRLEDYEPNFEVRMTLGR